MGKLSYDARIVACKFLCGHKIFYLFDFILLYFFIISLNYCFVFLLGWRCARFPAKENRVFMSIKELFLTHSLLFHLIVPFSFELLSEYFRIYCFLSFIVADGVIQILAVLDSVSDIFLLPGVVHILLEVILAALDMFVVLRASLIVF